MTTHHHLHLPRFPVAAVAVLGDRRTVSREVRAGQVIQHQLGLKIEQVPQPVIQGDFDRTLIEIQMVQRAIPTLQLRQVDPHATLLFPARDVPITSEAGRAVNPVGQAGSLWKTADEGLSRRDKIYSRGKSTTSVHSSGRNSAVPRSVRANSTGTPSVLVAVRNRWSDGSSIFSLAIGR